MSIKEKAKYTPPANFGEDAPNDLELPEEYRVTPKVESASTIGKLKSLLNRTEDNNEDVVIRVGEEGYVVVEGAVSHCGVLRLAGKLVRY